MKTILLSIVLITILSISANSQIYVSTTPMNKLAVIEGFTGVNAVNCPPGHEIQATILSENPTTAIVINYHPSNSTYTTPFESDPDFRRDYPAVFYSTPFCGTSRYMPAAFINRREWSAGERILSRSLWEEKSTEVMGEASPLNVGLYADYNSESGLLDVTVEVYFTSTVTAPLTLFVVLAENELVAEQLGATGSYTHYHVFREALVAEQWGEAITGSTSAASVFTQTYQFDNYTPDYVMENCEVSAFVRYDTDNENIITGNQVPVLTATNISKIDKESVLNIYPNPVSANSVAGIVWNNTETVNVTVFDISGRLINTSKTMLQNGHNVLPVSTLTNTELQKGEYILNITGSKDSKSINFIVQ